MSTRTVAINNCAPREGLVAMPSYTIQEDPPWMPRNRVSAAPSSVYSSASDLALDHHSEVSPQSLKQPSYTATCYAHPRQEITDSGPQYKRQSRLPIFKQVRTMLTKPNGTTKWDELSGEPSETGKPAQTNYVSPWEGAFEARRRSPERKNTKSKKNHSPVSILRDDGRNAGASRALGDKSRSISPVSTLHSLAPSQISVNSVATLPRALSIRKQVKRKPLRDTLSPASENTPPADLRSVHSQESLGKHLDSRFSWSTAAPALVGNRESTENASTRASKIGSNSRFSWSTIATNTTYTHHEETEAPSPVPAIPSEFLQPPREGSSQPSREGSPQPPDTMQSILSRKRPVQPRDRDTSLRTEPIRMYDSPSPSTSRATTPTARSASLKAPSVSSPPKSANKALPLPPFMTSEQANHLEHLIAQQNNVLMQRRNIEKMIAENEGKEKASPMEVSFSDVRDARKKLVEQKLMLSEIQREEMEVGIKIARARRKEDFGEGEGTLWVRRVTG